VPRCALQSKARGGVAGHTERHGGGCARSCADWLQQTAPREAVSPGMSTRGSAGRAEKSAGAQAGSMSRALIRT